jgi:hypothetical protein
VLGPSCWGAAAILLPRIVALKEFLKKLSEKVLAKLLIGITQPKTPKKRANSDTLETCWHL